MVMDSQKNKRSTQGFKPLGFWIKCVRWCVITIMACAQKRLIRIGLSSLFCFTTRRNQ